MRTSNDKKKFLEHLHDLPNISVVCKRIPIAKTTVYRWMEKDSKFKEQVEQAVFVGRGNITDLAEAQLVGRIKKGDMRAVEYWLDNNEPRYIKPRLPPLRNANYSGITEFNINLYKSKDNKEVETYSGNTVPEKPEAKDANVLE